MATYLNGGTSATLTPPSGSPIALSLVTQGTMSAYATNSPLTAVPSGTWGFSNTGGPDVGPLNFNFPIPAKVTWTNETTLANGTPIDRTQPLTITWTGGDANGYVDIVGSGQIGPVNSPAFTSYFDCSAPASASSFTIPPSILLSMPTGTTAEASLQVSTNPLPLSLPAIAGFDAGVNDSAFQTNVPVIFK